MVPSDSPNQLSRQEERVLELSITGLSDKEVAVAMGISFDTVRSYWARIRQKIGGSTRAEIIATMVHREAEVTLEASHSENQRLQDEIALRRLSEENLRKSEARLNEAQEIAQIGSWEFDVETQMYTASRMACRIYGLHETDEPFPASLVFEKIYPPDRSRIRGVIESAITTGGARQDEYHVVTESGGLRLVLVRRKTVVSEGKVIQVLGTVQDITDYRSLEEKTDQLTEVINATPDLVIVLSPNGQPQFLNAAARRFFGQPGSGPALSISPIAEIATGSQHLLEEVLDAISTEGTWAGETNLLDYRGQTVPFSAVLVGHRDRAGTLVNISAIMRDLSSHFQQDRAQSEKTAFLDCVMRSALHSVITTDPQGTITSMNLAAERMLGYNARELVGKANWLLLHDTDSIADIARSLSLGLGRQIPLGIEVLEAISESDESVARDWRYVSKTGAIIPADVSVSRLTDEKGEFYGYLKIGTDIRTRTQTLDRAKREERLSRQVNDFCPEPLYIYDILLDRIVYANQALEHVFGYSHEELFNAQNARWQGYVHPDDLEQGTERVEAILRLSEGETLSFTTRLRHHDGHYLLTRCSGFPFDFDDKGNPTKFFAFLHLVENQSDL